VLEHGGQGAVERLGELAHRGGTRAEPFHHTSPGVVRQGGEDPFEGGRSFNHLLEET